MYYNRYFGKNNIGAGLLIQENDVITWPDRNKYCRKGAVGLNHTGRVIDTFESETLNLCITNGNRFNIGNTILEQADYKWIYFNCIHYNLSFVIIIITSTIVIIYPPPFKDIK